MSDSASPLARLVGYGGFAGLVYCAETYLANATGIAVPLEPLLLFGGLGVVVVLAALMLGLDEILRRTLPWARYGWYALAAAVWLLHAHRVGFLGTPGPWMIVLGLAGILLVGRGRFDLLSWGVGFALLALVLSPDWVVQLEVVRRPASSAGPVLLAGFLLSPLLVILLVGLHERFVVPRLSGAFGRWALVGLVVLASGGTYLHWETLRSGSSSGSRFRGPLPEVHRTPLANQKELPNIVLISVDTLRWDLVPPRAPASLELTHLEKLRRDSLIFPRHFSTSSATLRSHASLFSGLLPPRHGAGKGGWRIHPEVRLYPQLLRRLGYATAGFVGGGWVSGKLGFDRGYDRYWEYPASHKEIVPGGLQLLEAAWWLFDRSFLLRVRERGITGDYLRKFPVTVDRTLDWLEAHRTRTDKRPFYLFLHTYHLHDYKRIYPDSLRRVRRRQPDLMDAPLVEEVFQSHKGRIFQKLANLLSTDGIARLLRRMEPSTRRAHRRFVRGLSGPQHARFDRNMKQLGVSDSLRELGLDRAARREARKQVKGWLVRLMKVQFALYRAGMEGIDRGLGDLLTSLKQKGLYDGTLIIFISDHGEGFRETSTASGHGHGQLQDVLVRTPLFVKLPGQVRGGERVDRLVQMTDVFPSLFHHLGIRPALPPETAPDQPRTDLFDPGDSPPRSVVRGLIPAVGSGSDPNMYIRTNDRKLVDARRASGRGWFGVGADGLVERRLEKDQVSPDTRRFLKGEMARYRIMHRREPTADGDTRPTAGRELREELEGLGYLQ